VYLNVRYTLDTVGEIGQNDGQMTHSRNLAKAEVRVVAGGTLPQWSVSLCILMAHAIATFCK
jgi:hypothetical protein